MLICTAGIIPGWSFAAIAFNSQFVGPAKASGEPCTHPWHADLPVTLPVTLHLMIMQHHVVSMLQHDSRHLQRASVSMVVHAQQFKQSPGGCILLATASEPWPVADFHFGFLGSGPRRGEGGSG